MKYLIVDDNPNVRKIIKEAICDDMDEVVECNDGKDAMTAYAGHLPDYVLMDIQMRTMDGLIATKQILEKYPAGRIIIITDYDTPAFRLAAKRAGACAFISKENLSEAKDYIKSKSLQKINYINIK